MVGKTAMGFLTMQDIARMGEKGIFEYASRTNIENWYEILKEHSIPTTVIPLDKESMLAIVHAIDDANRAKAPPDMTPSVIVGLVTSIDTVIRSLGSAFVRLSTRSPKDSTIAIQKGKSRYQAEIEGAANEWARNALLVKAQKHGMRVTSGAEAMTLLLTSTRIRDDIDECARFGFTPAIIVRKWVEIPEWAEFRGFVNDGKLVGLSQYFYFCKFPEIKEKEHEIVATIQTFYDSVKHQLPLDSCIIDFALVGGKPIILELNPLFMGTDACLFDWRKDKFETFEFRYLQ